MFRITRRRISILVGTLLLKPYSQLFLRENLRDMHSSLVYQLYFCLILTSFSFAVHNFKSNSLFSLGLLEISKFILIFYCFLLLFVVKKFRAWVDKNMEGFMFFTAISILSFFAPLLLLRDYAFEFYLHGATVLLSSFNIVLWISPLRMFLINSLFFVFEFYVSYLYHHAKEGSFFLFGQTSSILFSYLFLGFFANVLLNYSRFLNFRAHRKAASTLARLKRKSEEIQYLSKTDELTGLYTRRYLLEQFDVFKVRAARYTYPIGLIILDLDKLKEINDAWGHIQGDNAIRAVSKVLKDRVRKTDVSARIGGDEFCALLDAVDEKNMKRIAEGLRKGVESVRLHPVNGGKKPVRCTVSIGATILNPSEDFTFDDLYHSIDQALYNSKHSGRNRVTIIRPSRLREKN